MFTYRKYFKGVKFMKIIKNSIAPYLDIGIVIGSVIAIH